MARWGPRCAFPDRPVIVGCGDGCYLLSGFELLTAVRYDLPVIWIIFNDSEYKLIKLYQLSAYHESGLVDFANPDYVAYAKACGAQGFRVDSLAEFETALTTALGVGQADPDRRPHHSASRFPITARIPPASWRRSRTALRKNWSGSEAR